MTQILTIFLIFSLSSCSLNGMDQRAKSLLKEHKYPEAIKLLEENQNFFNKGILQDAYIGYGIWLLKNIKVKENKYYDEDTYALAKLQFKKAVDINPKNRKAQNLYQLASKLEGRYELR